MIVTAYKFGCKPLKVLVESNRLCILEVRTLPLYTNVKYLCNARRAGSCSSSVSSSTKAEMRLLRSRGHTSHVRVHLLHCTCYCENNHGQWCCRLMLLAKRLNYCLLELSKKALFSISFSWNILV